MNRHRPAAIDLFAGAGGMSLGFEQAGFDVAAAVEIDPIHAAVHKFNFPACAVIPASVVGLSADEIRKRARLADRPIQVVVGGAPCQGFSLIGQRAFDDPRNGLVCEFVRLVAELDAEYFVFENVKGLTVGRHKQFLAELIEAFDKRGYTVRLPWRVLNASRFSVPQDRERLILIGSRFADRLPNYPTETTIPAGSARTAYAAPFRNLPYGPSCRDAIGDLPDAEEFSQLWESDAVEIDDWKRSSSYARGLRSPEHDATDFGYAREWNPIMLTSSMRTAHTPISRRRFLMTSEGSVEPISRFYKLPAGGVANTLRAGTDSARGAFTSPRPIHYEKPRCITVREMARLHGFPDWFRFHATKWHGARQVGNAVAPPLARAIAFEIIRSLRVSPEKPDRALSLGDEALLRMDMSRAARYWRVSPPIGRRDRRSGARKRRQRDIDAIFEEGGSFRV